MPLLAGPQSRPIGSAAGSTGVDSLIVRKFYMDGDFDPAIAILESAMKSEALLTHDDSVFIFKHLGVMYAARYETRERGKMYMHRLLMTEPTAKIMDMYASDMIYMIFKNIQDEFETNRMKLERARELLDGNNGANAPKTNSGATAQKNKPWAIYGIWFGTATVALGAGIWILLAIQPASGDHHSL